MKKFAWLFAGALLPVAAAMAADAPGPNWAYLVPDPGAPAPVPFGAQNGGGGGGGGGGGPRPGLEGAPAVVATGKGEMVRPCSQCHAPSGMGLPETANLRGLNPDYIKRQFADFKSGARNGSRAAAMIAEAKNISDEDLKEAADYYSGLKPVQWTRVQEADSAPKTLVNSQSIRVKLDGTDMEPVGSRVIELSNTPQSPRQMQAPAFFALVPTGALAMGKNLVTTGGGKVLPCAGCHGENLKGMNDIPSIAGRSPVYIARQIYQFKNGIRTGTMANMMKSVVGKLSDDEVVDVAAYVGSLDPS